MAEGNGLLNRRSVLNATEGSNPSFSAQARFTNGLLFILNMIYFPVGSPWRTRMLKTVTCDFSAHVTLGKFLGGGILLMNSSDRIGACGDNCSQCPRFIATATKDVALLRQLSAIWLQAGWRERLVKAEELTCYGCNTTINCSNGVRQCAMMHSAENCGECSESKSCTIIENVIKKSDINRKLCYEIFPIEIYEILDKSFFRKRENLGLEKQD